MSKMKKLFLNSRMIILIIAVILSILFISPQPWEEGVAIRSVAKDSAADLAGISNPDAKGWQTSREKILSINGDPIVTEEDYFAIVDDLDPNQSISMSTTKSAYRLITQPILKITTLPELEEQEIMEEIFDEEANATINVTRIIEVNKTTSEIIGVKDIGIGVYPMPKNNLRKGLDLSGGTRVLLRPDGLLTIEEQDLLLDNLRARLNAFGLSDVTVRTTKDLSGELFILVEIAGANEEQIKSLLGQQGKFEAKISNSTVFTGGEDITFVCRSAECSGLQQGCFQTADSGWTCRFNFLITLTPEAAQRQADATENLAIDFTSGSSGQNQYLNESIELYLDNALVDSLRIGSTLKGNAVTDITISGSGDGRTQSDARMNSLDEMKRLQTILITGSLPVKLDVVKTDTISPALGEQFLNNLIFIGIVAAIAVSLILYIRYRKPLITVPLIISMVSEILIIFGVAALIRWNLDLVAIAGIIVAIGTSVDAQIVIVDETLRKEVQFYRWKDKVKNAFFIIMASYFTLVVAMLPLFWAGAGLLKGFALTTILGVSVGVFITRPAFAKMAEVLLKD